MSQPRCLPTIKKTKMNDRTQAFQWPPENTRRSLMADEGSFRDPLWCHPTVTSYSAALWCSTVPSFGNALWYQSIIQSFCAALWWRALVPPCSATVWYWPSITCSFPKNIMYYFSFFVTVVHWDATSMLLSWKPFIVSHLEFTVLVTILCFLSSWLTEYQLLSVTKIFQII